MKIILFSAGPRKNTSINLGRAKVLVPMVGLFLVLAAGLVTLGFQLGQGTNGSAGADVAAHWEAEIRSQRVAIDEARKLLGNDVDALALRLGQLQARMTRLDALGRRMVDLAKLNQGEFDFESVPGLGGPGDSMATEPAARIPDLEELLDQLEQHLADREQQVQALTSVINDRQVKKEVTPAGRPIKHGWLSSHYGWRTDPFTGRRDFHGGMDFAGKLGSPVVAAAAGVVTSTRRRSGYGSLVEINHGNGYVTRYGHNRKVLVHVGDTVEKGQVIAQMGSSGRSTGPHVHFEVLHYGKSVNPSRFVKSAG